MALSSQQNINFSEKAMIPRLYSAFINYAFFPQSIPLSQVGSVLQNWELSSGLFSQRLVDWGLFCFYTLILSIYLKICQVNYYK
jgi:hypothetical protein